jgi:hypothetical protein
MQLRFTINRDLLIACALFSERGKKLKAWASIKNTLWDKYEDAYELFIYKRVEKYFANSNFESRLNNAASQIRPLFDECGGSKEFSKLYEKTLEYKNWLEGEWGKNSEKILNELESILKIDLPDTVFTVQVVHPTLGRGSYLGNYNIFWGHTELWPNYSIIYLMHEALHEIIGVSDMQHLAIELATDNELRVRLNKEDYLVNNEPIGHAEHKEELLKLLPSWIEYIKSPNETIFDFIDKLEKRKIPMYIHQPKRTMT